MSDENNPFKIIMQEKLNSSKTVNAKETESTGWKILKWVGIGFLIFFLILLFILIIWALSVAYQAKNEAQSNAQNCQQAAPGAPGAQGVQGPQGPQGPPGTFYFVGLGAVSGIYTSGCVKVPTEGKLTIPNTDHGYLVFDKRLPDNGRLSDNMGTVTIGQDGIYVMYVTVDLHLLECCKPVVVRVYKNNTMFGYYEFHNSGSHSFTFANNYLQGDQVKISIISDSDSNQLISHGSFVSVLGC
jgi:hypothetical protein